MTTFEYLFIIISLLILGLMYYAVSVSKSKILKKGALFYKLLFLVLSFIFAITKQDFITTGNLIIDNSQTVMILIVFEIADIFVDIKTNKQR